RRLHSCRIIPERGSWIEINVTKKETLGVRIDQSGKFSAMTLLRAMDPAFSTDSDILKAFYPTEEMKVTAAGAASLVKKIACGDIIDPETGEVLLDAALGDLEISEEMAEKIAKSNCRSITVIDPKKIKDRIILESIKEDHGGKGQQADTIFKTHEQAL